MTSPIVNIPIENDYNIRLFLKREDLLHPHISGNKFRKLKFNIEEAKTQNANTILTFGGAFSNHIAATAYACKINGIKSIGIIRGEELKEKVNLNPTLKFAQNCGMKFHFVSREEYRMRANQDKLDGFANQFGQVYIIPEGGTNHLAVKGCREILDETTEKFDVICTSVGTGGTISGIINACRKHQEIFGFPALKGDFLREDIRKFATQNNWRLIMDYHFGGYAKINAELVSFINDFNTKYSVPLDPIYTGKLMYGIFDMIDKGMFRINSKILAIHTGGLQGIKGMNQRLKQKSMPLIKV